VVFQVLLVPITLHDNFFSRHFSLSCTCRCAFVLLILMMVVRNKHSCERLLHLSLGVPHSC
jgi:hypothetical protein